MKIVDRIRQTEKGRLSYERETSGPSLKGLLETCSSPPQIQVSPSLTKNIKLEEENKQSKDDDRSSTDTNDDKPSLENLLNQVNLGDKTESSKVKVAGVISPEYGKSMVNIQKYEAAFETRAREACAARQRQYEEEMARIQQTVDVELELVYEAANRRYLQQVQQMELLHSSQAAEIVKRHRQLKESHEHIKQVHDTRIQEAERTKQRMLEEEAQRRAEESKLRLQLISKCVVDLGNLNKKIQNMYSTCKYGQFVSEAAKKSLSLLQQLVANAEQLRSSCQELGETSPEKVGKVQRILEQARNAYEFVKQEIGKAVVQGSKQEAEEKVRQEQAQAQAADTASASTTASSSASTSSTSQTTSDVSSAAAQAATEGGETLCVDIEAFKQYTALQEKLKVVETASQNLASTPELKKLKFDIQKAVNTPINAISPVNGSHLRDKLERLMRLVSGQQIEVTGRRISIQGNQDAIIFCKNLIGRMFVKKADEQVSSNYESAFAIAMVAVGLWHEHPDIGNFLLAHFHAMCPYTVPYYIPKQEGQSTEDHLKARGYRFEDSTVEKQDKFLRRMSGIMRLYASIMVSSPPRGQHPHGVENAWIWLCRVMNILPEPDITATMIFDLLQVTGHALFEAYRKQFQRLQYTLVKDFLPKLKVVASPAGRGALSRLELLLETSIRHGGNIPKPDGLLQHSFWMS